MVEQSKLKEIFVLNSEDGNFYNKFTRNSRAMKGKLAGYIVNYKSNKDNDSPLQYRYVRIDNKAYRIHRLVWIYVYGETGGILRFKEERHGIEFVNVKNEFLPYSAIIGYVLDNDFNYWFKKINGCRGS